MWDAYAARHPRATFFHGTGWKRVLEAGFGYPARYLVAHRAGTLCGVLPLFLCRSMRGRKGLYSLPHTVYGGPLADDAEAERALLGAARAQGARDGASRLELRNRHATGLDLPALPGFVTFEKELPATPAEVFRSLPKKAREAVRQATRKHSLEAQLDGSLGDFYDLLASSYHRLGTPVFPARFFEALAREFPTETGVLIVRHQGEPVAGVLSVVFRDTMMPLYSGETPAAAALRANNFKYLRLMEHAVERGLRRFDFGRSRLSNEGVVRFKQNQGFPIETLPYQIEPALAGVSDPNRGAFLKARSLWRRLPDRVARVLGPRIVRYFP